MVWGGSRNPSPRARLVSRDASRVLRQFLLPTRPRRERAVVLAVVLLDSCLLLFAFPQSVSPFASSHWICSPQTAPPLWARLRRCVPAVVVARRTIEAACCDQWCAPDGPTLCPARARGLRSWRHRASDYFAAAPTGRSYRWYRICICVAAETRWAWHCGVAFDNPQFLACPYKIRASALPYLARVCEGARAHIERSVPNDFDFYQLTKYSRLTQ